MSVANFERSLAAVLKHEGGYVNHPKDPGGATNMGITHKTLAAWRKVESVTRADVRNLTVSEVRQIYRAQYWAPIKGDQLPLGLDYAVFDFGVNSGVGRAVRFLQQLLKNMGLYDGAIDGLIGAKTIKALDAIDDVDALIIAYCDKRLAFLKRLKGWSTFGKGWKRRVTEVQDLAVDVAEGSAGYAPQVAVAPTEVSSCRTPHDVAGATDVSAIKTIEGQGGAALGVGTAGTALSEAAAQIQPLAEYSKWIQMVFVGLLVAGIGLTLWTTLKGIQRQNAEAA